MIDKREAQALISKARHNLKNPVNAILGFSEMLIEDCEEEGLDSLIPDLKNINKSGKEVLEIIEESFSDTNLAVTGGSVSEIASEMEISIRTPLNTVIGFSEMLMEDNPNSVIDTFIADLDKISKSAKALSDEIYNVINFNPINSIDNIQSTKKSISDIQSVLKSIQPIDSDESKKISNGRILVVDDNKNNTTLLKKRLEKIGNEIYIENNGRNALEIIKDIKFDLILLDIIMPVMNGYEVLEFLKNDQRFYDIPVIMLSSMDDKSSIYRCIEIGADDYVTKPFDRTILEARISACIEKKILRDKQKALLEEIKFEKEKSENLLLNILPLQIANRLKKGDMIIADKHDMVSILFADIVNFTPQSKNMSPVELVEILNKIFTKFDDLSTKYGIEKIKTIGDNYFAVSGLSGEFKKSALDLLQMSIDMVSAITSINNLTNKMDINIRIGIHTGPIVAGVIGKKKFAYDLWGASVNMASRMESSGKPGKIHISSETYKLIKNDFICVPRDQIKLKGIGLVKTYFIVK